MPTTQVKVVFPGTGATTTASLPADKGRLTSVSLLTGTTAIDDCAVYARIGLFRGSGVGAVELAQLAAGYCGFMTPLAWQGDLNLEADFEVFLLGRSHTAATYTFAIITDKGS